MKHTADRAAAHPLASLRRGHARLGVDPGLQITGYAVLEVRPRGLMFARPASFARGGPGCDRHGSPASGSVQWFSRSARPVQAGRGGGGAIVRSLSTSPNGDFDGPCPRRLFLAAGSTRRAGGQLQRHAHQEDADRQRPCLQGAGAAYRPARARVWRSCRNRPTWPTPWPRRCATITRKNLGIEADHDNANDRDAKPCARRGSSLASGPAGIPGVDAGVRTPRSCRPALARN